MRWSRIFDDARRARGVAAVWICTSATVAILGVVAALGGRGATGARVGAFEPPYATSGWIGRDVPTPPSVVALLHPSALIDRTYVNLATGESAELLYVNCGDARDLIGHYPPVCYPAHGAEQTSARRRDLVVGGVVVPTMRYRFRAGRPPTSRELVVDNFMLLPDGSFGRDMESVDAAARDRRRRELGAAEVQVATDESMDDDRRDAAFRALVAPIVAHWEAIRREEHP